MSSTEAVEKEPGGDLADTVSSIDRALSTLVLDAEDTRTTRPPKKAGKKEKKRKSRSRRYRSGEESSSSSSDDEEEDVGKSKFASIFFGVPPRLIKRVRKDNITLRDFCLLAYHQWDRDHENDIQIEIDKSGRLIYEDDIWIEIDKRGRLIFHRNQRPYAETLNSLAAFLDVWNTYRTLRTELEPNNELNVKMSIFQHRITRMAVVHPWPNVLKELYHVLCTALSKAGKYDWDPPAFNAWNVLVVMPTIYGQVSPEPLSTKRKLCSTFHNYGPGACRRMSCSEVYDHWCPRCGDPDHSPLHCVLPPPRRKGKAAPRLENQR